MNTDGFSRAVLAHKDRLHSYATWMLQDREEARDVTQEALVRLWQNRQRVIDETARAWLLRTTHNLCIDRLRRRSVRAEVPSEELEPSLQDEGVGPERRAASVQLRGSIGRALARLSDRDRAAVVMREVQGMSYDEIAQVMDVPMGTLKSVLHRSREQLRRELSQEGVLP